MIQSHTPTPYREENGYILDNASDMIAACYGPVLGKKNAVFIVRACNAHDDLVAALRGLTVWIDKNHPDHEAMVEYEHDSAVDSGQNPDAEEILRRKLDKAIAALAKAKAVQS